MGNRMDARQMRTAPVFQGNVRQMFQNYEQDEKLSWIIRATNWIGLTMARPETPSGWSFNPATVTLALVVAGGILTGGYLWGENVTERRHLMERIQIAQDEAKAATAKAQAAEKMATYAAAGADEAAGHKPNQKEKAK